MSGSRKNYRLIPSQNDANSNIKKSSGFVDSLLTWTGRRANCRAPGEEIYELEIGGRKRNHSDLSLSLLNREGDGGSAAWTILTFANSILGAGLTSIPYALMRSGLLLGILLIILVTFIMSWSVRLLIRCGRLAGATSYQDLMKKSFGVAGGRFCSLFHIIFTLGGMCAHMIILADNVTKFTMYYFPASIFADRGILVLACTLFIILPLSISGNSRLLSELSSLSAIAVGFTIIALLWESLHVGFGASVRLAKWSFLDSLGLFSFSLVCHQESFEVHDALDIPSVSKFSRITNATTVLCAIASLLIAVPSYLCFADATEANVLNNFSQPSFFINSSRLLLAWSMLLSYPVSCTTTRDTLIDFIYGDQSATEWNAHLITIALVGITLAVSLGYSNLETILEVTGGLAASGLAFIFPAACYLQLAPCDSFSRGTRLGAKLLIVFGIILFVSSTGITLYKATFSS